MLHPLAGRGGRRNVRVSDSPSDLSSQTSIRSSCRTDYSRPRLPRRSPCIPRAPRATLWGGIGHRHRRIGRWVVQTSRRSDTSWPLSQSNTAQSGKSLANSLAVEPVQTRTAASTSETLDRRCHSHFSQIASRSGEFEAAPASWVWVVGPSMKGIGQESQWCAELLRSGSPAEKSRAPRSRSRDVPPGDPSPGAFERSALLHESGPEDHSVRGRRRAESESARDD